MTCPTHPQSIVWHHPDGDRCSICGYFFDGREPRPAETTVIRSLNHYQNHSIDRSGFAQGIFKLDAAYVGLSLAGEGGEIADAIKKHVYHGHPLNKEALAEELGDLLWGVSMSARFLGYTLEEIANMNAAKLRRRYPPDGFFNPEQSRNRTEK